MSFTKGPWGWMGNHLVQARKDGSVPLNAKMIMKEPPVFFNDDDSRLVGAAPELLNALCGLYTEIKQHYPSCELHPDLVEQVESVIKKAIGGEE